MKSRHRLSSLLAAGAFALAGAVWLHASMAENDDRPLIIVRAGSLIFENGGGAMPGTPWTHDSVLGEWKPADNNYKGIRGFDVTFEDAYNAPACAASTMSGDPVRIEYTTASGRLIDVRFHRRRAHLGGLFGKHEPKLDASGYDLIETMPAPPAAQLKLEDGSKGWISKVTVGSQSCVFPPPPPAPDPAREKFHVRIQPKSE